MANTKHIIRWSVVVVIIVILGVWLVSRFFADQGATEGQATMKSKAGGGKSGAGVIPVTVNVAAKRQVLDGIRSVGNMVANEEVELSSEISGKIRALKFNEGTRVSKCDVLVEINDDDLQVQLKRLEFQKKTLAERLERQRLLFEQEAVSRESYDQVQTEYNVLLADMEVIQVRVERSQIKAPFSGVVGFRYVSEGSYIQPNSKIAKLVDYNTIKLEFGIPEKYVNMKLVGQTVYFTVESDPNPYTAIIYAMEPKVEEDTRTVILRARYNNNVGRFRPGMSCRVTIPTTAAVHLLMIPTQAVVPTLDGKSVWIVKNGEPLLQPVETGTRLEKDIEITRGLNTGDSVIITGLMQLREGSKISIH